MICISCPLGCELQLDIVRFETRDAEQKELQTKTRLLSVSGHECDKGKDFAQREIENPSRLMTSVVRIKNCQNKLLPVISADPLPLAKIKEAIKEMQAIIVEAPVKAGDIISENLAGCQIRLLAARSLAKKDNELREEV